MARNLEDKFTSTVAKLLKQHDRMPEWEKGVFRPISLQLAPTDRCNLKCVFCSVSERPGEELDFAQVRKCIDSLVKMGLKTVDITGGGDPTLYPYLVELIETIYEHGLGMGLITNGVALVRNVPQRHLDMLDWVRISMNCLDYVDDVEIPVFRKMEKNTILGFSYVVNEGSKAETIEKILDKAEKYWIDYLRVVPNCLTTESIEASKGMAQTLGLLDHPKVFWQEKKYSVPHHCRIGYIKPFLNADGFFYHCSANPLLERRFHPSFRMGHMDQVLELWRDFEPFDTHGCQDGKCFFKEHNDLLDLFDMAIIHRDFV